MRAKGEGSVYFEHAKDCPHPQDERRDSDCAGRWVAQLDVGVGPDGKRRRPKRIADSKREGHRLLQQLRREMGVRAAVEGITVGEWCEQWLDDCGDRVRAGTMAPKTAVGYEAAVRVHIKPACGQVRLDQLQPGHVQRMLTGMQAKGLKPKTAAHARGTLSAALSAAIQDGLIQVNAARLTTAPQVKRSRPSAFNDEEMSRLAEGCRDHRLGNAFVFDALSGLRASELLGLLWVDVDLEDGTYTVSEGLHQIGRKSARRLGIEHGQVRSKPKNVGSGERTPMSPAAVDVLKRQHRQQLEERLAAGPRWVDSGHVFTMPDGRPVLYSHLYKQFEGLLVELGIPTQAADGQGRGLHELRRTFATRLRELGIGLEQVQRLGRWASPSMLLNIYRAVDDESLRKAAGDADGDIAW